LFCSLAFGHAGEYFWVTHALAPFSLAPMSFDTTPALTALHLESYNYFPLFFEDYKPDQNFELSFDSFKLVPTHVAFINMWSFWDGF